MVTDIVAAFVYDLEAGRPNARARAEERLGELRTRFAGALKNVATQDSTRAARQLVPLGRPLSDFAGAYEDPSYGTMTFTLEGGRLQYRWGALYGPVEIFDGTKGQLRIEIAGSGTVVAFEFPGAGPARSAQVQGVTLTRKP